MFNAAFNFGVEKSKDVAMDVANETLNTAKWMAMKYLVIIPAITFVAGTAFGFAIGLLF